MLSPPCKQFPMIVQWVLFLWFSPVLAHELNTSYTDIQIQPATSELTCTLLIDRTELESLFSLDVDGNGQVSDDEIELMLEEIQAYFQNRVEIVFAGDTLGLAPLPPFTYDDGLGNTFVNFSFTAPLAQMAWELTLSLAFLEDFKPLHKNLVKVTCGAELVQAILTPGYTRETFAFGGETSVLRQSWQFVVLGIEHIFLGYDHILFLLALILIGGGFRNLVKIVTSFTVAHSLTLVLAALQIVMLPTRLVESVIAFSIVYIAGENFFVKQNDQRWFITFVFGLMHGFGFASVLAELGLPTQGLVASLLSFNVGVEVGQIAIVSLAYPAILLIGRSDYRRQIVFGLSSIILIFGLIWFVERAFNLQVAAI